MRTLDDYLASLSPKWRKALEDWENEEPVLPKTAVYHFTEKDRFFPQPFKKLGVGFFYSYWMRPWELVKDMWHDLASFIHRGRYGWDMGDTWSMDMYLAIVISQMLRHLKACHVAYWNDDSGNEGYEIWLEKTAQAFEGYWLLMESHQSVRNDDPRWEDYRTQMKDLITHFWDLSD